MSENAPSPQFSSDGARRVLEALSDKWTVPALYVLTGGTKRFGEIRSELKGITQKMLTQTLRKLEGYKLVTRTVHPVVPSMVEYALTPAGHSLIHVLNGLGDWLDVYMSLTEPKP